MDKETNLNRELGKHVGELNNQQYAISKQVDSLLAYEYLGLNNIKKENDSEERIKEDLKK